MNITLVEFSVILDTLDKSLMIGGREIFSYDSKTREAVRDHLMKIANVIAMKIAIADIANGEYDEKSPDASSPTL